MADRYPQFLIKFKGKTYLATVDHEIDPESPDASADDQILHNRTCHPAGEDECDFCVGFESDPADEIRATALENRPDDD